MPPPFVPQHYAQKDTIELELPALPAMEQELTLRDVLLFVDEYLEAHPERVDEAQLIGRPLVDLRLAIAWERFGSALFPLFLPQMTAAPARPHRLQLAIPSRKKRPPS